VVPEAKVDFGEVLGMPQLVEDIVGAPQGIGVLDDSLVQGSVVDT